MQNDTRAHVNPPVPESHFLLFVSSCLRVSPLYLICPSWPSCLRVRLLFTIVSWPSCLRASIFFDTPLPSFVSSCLRVSYLFLICPSWPSCLRVSPLFTIASWPSCLRVRPFLPPSHFRVLVRAIRFLHHACIFLERTSALVPLSASAPPAGRVPECACKPLNSIHAGSEDAFRHVVPRRIA